MTQFTGEDEEEDGARLVAAAIVALEDEAKALRKKILKIEQLGYLDPTFDPCAARERLQEIELMLEPRQDFPKGKDNVKRNIHD